MAHSYVQSLFDKAVASSDKAEAVACLAALDQVVALEQCFWGKDSESVHDFAVCGFWDLDGGPDCEAV